MIILAKIHYKTYSNKLLAIVKAFETWRRYLKDCKYEFLIFTNYNNLRYFINMKSLYFGQVCYTQALSEYEFLIDYYQVKTNRITDTLSR